MKQVPPAKRNEGLWRRMTKLHVDYNDIGNLIAPETAVKELMTFINCLARMSDYCPIDLATCSKVPSEGKELAWRRIEKMFSTNESDVAVIATLLALMGRAWKEFKNDLKTKLNILCWIIVKLQLITLQIRE